MQRTYSPRVLRADGGFAGLFRLDFPDQLFARNYQDPVLVACTDGVGTKIKVAASAERCDTIGIDLVAMCVNDAICCGAEPLLFLDYVAMSRDDPPLLEEIVKGISQGCLEADCALLGGETAIMPDLYATGEFDLAGFCVGVVERGQLIDGANISSGDVVLGLASSGLHSNGFSLVRQIVREAAGLSYQEFIPELDGAVADVLLTPTRIYVSVLRRVLRHYKVKNVVHGVAHITGGGLLENLSRILPSGKQAVIERDAWEVPPVFAWLQNLGRVDEEEMDRVFNRGIGLVIVVSEFYAGSVAKLIADAGVPCWRIGTVADGDGARWK
jgi:phosphoribosylformylglycinamidine cyclo-ligase